MNTVSDVLHALDRLTGGRVVKSLNDLSTGEHPFVLPKSSNIPGKGILELPGLVYGKLDQPVKKIAVTMTMTEGSIELAHATGVDAIVAHHPIAEGANSGGVILKNYLDLYNIAAFELHEAFHGLHPGISLLHGHEAYRKEISYGGLEGNILFVGKTIPEVKVLGDILTRLENLMKIDQEEHLLMVEKDIRSSQSLTETSIVTRGHILNGDETTSVNNIIHIFPHTGFTAEHLRKAYEEHPEADTVLASISRVDSDHELVQTANELGLNFIVGNSHVLEILENGLPLAYALNTLLPDTEVVIFRERITSMALQEVGGEALQKYAEEMSENFLVKKQVTKSS
ncbi:Nif3-like dinuclear metal center hexameric protein [Aliibacillus thermotolerans]|uniref:GTP cyclohydrolase 1 type 2 homolog n=1 Tax=Aliibacillus thermotolerans TaxID=1834418 RepID=A0ABW0U2L8_9BACI|nr:Nif3-like dinuclear metal center hexameric protein [Aliibacillus thermotolerans]MDA3129511.1 NGG1p interacting factor NIF3 [Aliibacillus thermotolerans]